MFSYTVSKNTDKEIFLNTCRLIEEFLKEYEKEKLLRDVDGTEIQIYRTISGEVKVVNDYEVDAVYVDSEINLKEIFGNVPIQYEELFMMCDDTIDAGKEPLPIISEDTRRTMEMAVTYLDGTKEKREEIMREFFGLKPGQTYQDLDVENDE